MRCFEEQAKLHPDVEGTWFQMVIEHVETGKIIGDCAMKAIEGQPGQVEIGFTLAAEHQGKGYATEAVARLLDYVFGELGKHRVIAVTDARNARRGATAGAVRDETRGAFPPEHMVQRVGWGDEFLYALLNQEWLGSRHLIQV